MSSSSLKQRPNLRPQFNLEFGIVLQVGNDITLGGGKCENISQSPSRSTLDIQFHVISTLLPPPPIPPQCLPSTPVSPKEAPLYSNIAQRTTKEGEG